MTHHKESPEGGGDRGAFPAEAAGRLCAACAAERSRRSTLDLVEWASYAPP